jgi:hypothetical protein
MFYQSYNLTITKYVEYFRVLVGVMETYEGMCRYEPGLIKAQLTTQGVTGTDLDSPNPIKLRKALAVCRKEYLSCIILQGLDNIRFYQLKTDLANSMVMRQDNFPKTIVETQCLLNGYKTPPRQQRVTEPENDKIAFVQGRDCSAPPPIRSIKCWHCQKKSHYKSNWPKLQVQELDMGMQNLSINNCKEMHNLFSVN